MSQPATVIHIQRLTKAFGKVRALDGLDLTVHPGEVHGFLGPNGAGKSTTIRILLGLIRATSGHAELFGATLGERPVGSIAGWPTSRGTSRSGPG